MKKIPFRPVTMPCTAKHSRKSSKEKTKSKNYQKNSCFNSNIASSSNTKLKQSTSLSKIKQLLIPNTNDFRTLLSKYSLVSHLTSQSNNKQNAKTYMNTNANSNSLSKSYIKNNNNDMKLVPSSSYQANSLFSHNGHKFNLKIQSSTTTKQNINKCLPVTLPTSFNKKFDELGSNSKSRSKKREICNKNFNTKMYYSNNIFSKIQNIDFIFNKFPQNSQAKTQNNTNINIKKKINITNAFHQNSNSNSASKAKKNTKTQKTVLSSLSSPKVNIKISYHNKHSNKKMINSSSLSNQSFSTTRESKYYSSESKKMIEYIKSFAMKHNYNEYPKTTIDFYKIGRSVGHGAFGKVNIGLHVLSGHIVAIKSFNKSKQLFSRSKINYEIKLMKKLRGNKNIVKLFEYVETDKYNCIIMENVPGGNLLSLIRKRTKLPENTSRYIFKQIIEAIKYIHSQGIAHRDIKPDNILIDLNNTIKICDFGVGKEIRPGQLIRDTCGTPAFVAPEILSDTPYDPFLTDIWSSGVVLYAMLSGFFPFIGNNDYELHKSITSGKFAEIEGISNECSDLLHRILEVDPVKRITINEILGHKWLMNENISYDMLFTNAEKIIFSKLNLDYRNSKKEDLLELFTDKNLDSDLEDENQNASTRSVVNVPFNSKIRTYYNDDDDEFFEDLNIEDSILKFNPKVNELNRNYEINFNSEADQGRKKAKGRGLMSSFNNSINKEYQQREKVNENNNSNDNKINILDNNNNLCDLSNKNSNKKNKDTMSTNSATFYVDENCIKFVEDFGYKREFIMKSLEGNEINHATACYYLKMSLLNE